MIDLVRTGTWCSLKPLDSEGQADVVRLLPQLTRRFSYFQKGAQFAPSFQNKAWDGRIHLVRSSAKGVRFPSGIFLEVEAMLLEAKALFGERDLRPEIAERPRLSVWAGYAPYDYQRRAAEAAIAGEGGVLKMSIRSGKTLTAGWVIHLKRWRTLFAVPSKMLLDQTADALQRCLPEAQITRLGDGDHDLSGDLVIGTYQSLAKLSPEEVNEEPFGLTVIDEAHHISSGNSNWSEGILQVNAREKIGLTGTIDLPKAGPIETAAIWVRGICGPIRYEVSMSDLVRAGRLTEPTITFLSYDAPKSVSAWCPEIEREVLTECEPRNRRIVEAAAKEQALGKRVLVDARYLDHCNRIFEMARVALPPGRVALLTGKTAKRQREKVMRGFKDGSVPVVVGTLLGEGIDIPELEVVINAEGGKSAIAVVQRLRNLTKADGKDSATVYELADKHHPRLREWTLARLDEYEKHDAFKIEFE